MTLILSCRWLRLRFYRISSCDVSASDNFYFTISEILEFLILRYKPLPIFSLYSNLLVLSKSIFMLDLPLYEVIMSLQL